MTDRDRLMFENMAYIILEDYTTSYSKTDKDTLARYLQKTFNDYLIANGVTVGDANNATTTWRPASEPPKEEGMYLCINEDGIHFEAYYSQIYEEFGIDSAIYDPQTLGFLDTEWQGYSVTHWMPLPQPPKEVL